MKRCVSCGQLKDEEEFNWRYKDQGIRQSSCRDCQHGHQSEFYRNHQEEEKERTKQRKVKTREEARAFVCEYLSSHPCQRCGESDPRVLEFDHIRGKGENVARLISEGASIERIRIEVSLCQVLCSNCHRKKTSDENGWFKGRL
jgi:hypothetical protein